MASMELNSLPTIVEQIRQLCIQLRTGTVFLVSDQNRMVQVHLDRGEIALLMHRNRRGQEALQIIAGMRQARLRFDEGYVTKAEKDTLSTRAVLDYLHAAAQDVPPSATAQDSGAAPAIALNGEVTAAIEAIMTRYIGPMAEIVCAEHFARATDLPALIQGLAGEFPVQAHAARFRAEIAQALKLDPDGAPSR